MSCDVAELILQAFSVASPTSQVILILQAFRHFTYVTTHSQTLLSPLLRHRIFTYVTWLAVHVKIETLRSKNPTELRGALSEDCGENKDIWG